MTYKSPMNINTAIVSAQISKNLLQFQVEPSMRLKFETQLKCFKFGLWFKCHLMGMFEKTDNVWYFVYFSWTNHNACFLSTSCNKILISY